MQYQNPSAPTLPPQPPLPTATSPRHGLRTALVVLATLALIALVVSTAPAALTKARTAAYPRPSLGPISISGAASGSPISVNQTIQFSVAVIAGRDLTYHWDFGNGDGSDSPSPTYTYTQYNPGIQVSVEVTDPIGQSARQSTDIAVLPAPPVINALNVSSYYYGSYYCNYVDATVNASSDVSLTFQWNWGDGNSDSTSYPEATHTYGSNGTYTITVTAVDTYNQTTTATQTVNIAC
jgi:hypothetical protein